MPERIVVATAGEMEPVAGGMAMILCGIGGGPPVAALRVVNRAACAPTGNWPRMVADRVGTGHVQDFGLPGYDDRLAESMSHPGRNSR